MRERDKNKRFLELLFIISVFTHVHECGTNKLCVCLRGQLLGCDDPGLRSSSLYDKGLLSAELSHGLFNSLEGFETF